LLLGPFYPVASAKGAAASDLWREDAPPPDGARRMRLVGRVVDARGHPAVGALVEIWHADPYGRYPHPSAPDHEHVAPGFTGYGCMRSNGRGRFAFRSLVPEAYVAGGVRRAPHVHVQVTANSDRLVTQMFLPRHPLNGEDRWYRMVARPESLTADVMHDDADVLELAWTIVLAHG